MPVVRATERAPCGRALFSLCRRGRVLCRVLGLAGFLGLHHGTAAADCPADHVDERVKVAYVYDGDTLVLTDGRKVRLIGINTPELPRDNSPGQPFAREAHAALAGLFVADHALGLRFDEQHVDRYGRLLAHLYRTDGESVQSWLLQQGYAVAIAVPPNLWSQDCYRRAEEQASRTGSGLWRLSYYTPRASTRIKPDSLEEGFRLVRGRVVRGGEGASAVWLNLDGGLALRIARPDLRYFPEFRPDDLMGRVVVARGWLYAHGGAPVMQIRHPSALHIVVDEETMP